MEEIQKINNTEIKETAQAAETKDRASVGKKYESRERKGPRSERDKEFDQKIISIRRVTRVVSGGRRMSFSVTIVIGDKKGSVGLGTGKAVDTALAIGKAIRDAKKNMFKIQTTEKMSITHEVLAKYGSAEVFLMPNKARGLVAGSSVRDVLKLGGLRDITAKIHTGSKNKLNIARAAIKALRQL
jgi:small subunit ribosomal protein S5